MATVSIEKKVECRLVVGRERVPQPLLGLLGFGSQVAGELFDDVFLQGARQVAAKFRFHWVQREPNREP